MNDELVLPAEIVIDDFQEKLYIPITYWKLSDYKMSWLKSLEHGLTNKEHSVLAVSMYEPVDMNFIFIWVIYFHDNKVFIQNKVLFLDEHPDFTVDRINDFIDSCITYNEDGMKTSEWNTDLKSVIHFYESLK
jgi:hypothetical protein